MKGQWYPGHMARTNRVIRDLLRVVDVVIEVVDARVPASSRNPDVDTLVGTKPRIIAMNKADLAAVKDTARWAAFFGRQGHQVVVISATEGRGVKELTAAVRGSGKAKAAARARRAMILGTPNVGKSSLINRLAGRARARTGAMPGVTRGPQWVRVGSSFELLDLPGTLPPRAGDPDVVYRLAATGALEVGAFDQVEVAIRLIGDLFREGGEALRERYGIEGEEPQTALAEMAMGRGLLKVGGQPDLERAAQVLLAEFRDGRLGHLTLDPLPVEPGGSSGPGHSGTGSSGPAKGRPPKQESPPSEA